MNAVTAIRRLASRHRTTVAISWCLAVAACGGHDAADRSGHQAAPTPASPAPAATASPHSAGVAVDTQTNPKLMFRVDSFSVPPQSRAEFAATMHQNAEFLAKLPGFAGHVVLEKTAGASTFNIVTLASWDSADAMKSAGEQVRADYQRTGFDMQATIARWGVTASIGGYHALPGTKLTSATIDARANPNLQFHVGSMSVPAGARAELDTMMRDNADGLAKLPGFVAHLVFEKASGPTTFNIVIIAIWASADAMNSADARIRDDDQRRGFDMMATLARLGVTVSAGEYHAPVALQ